LDQTALDNHRLDRLLAVGRSLVSELDLEIVLNRVLEAARDLTGARYAALGILDERREELERFVTLGVDDATHEAIGDLPRGRGVLGVLIREPRPLRLSNVGDHPLSYGFPPNHPPMKTFLGVPILIRGEAFGNLYLTEKQGGEFDEQDEESAMVLAAWAAVAIENARLYERTETRRRELERAVRGLEGAIEIAQAVGGETRLERVLELIAKRGRALVEARSLVIMLVDGGELSIAATAGEASGDLLGQTVPIEGSIAGQVLRSGRSERFANLGDALPISLARYGVDARSALDVPLLFRGQALGVLAAFDKLVGGPQFGREDELLLQGFAASAATAVHTAQSVTEERLRQSLAAAEQERRRWARELHDETLQGLGALRVLLSSALKNDSPDARQDMVREAVAQIGHEIESLRGLITELRPAALDELGLEPAIESLVQRTSALQGLDVDARIELDGQQRLAPELESAVYRIVQEALTNISKHARAEHVHLEVVREPDAVHLLVRDDGQGFDPTSPTGGFGLSGMRERVELARGTMEVESEAGRGTTINARVPIPGQARRAAS
jgi:two-component system, NarL family, sensor histidine kinase DevS